MKVCYVCGEYPPAVHGGIGSLTQISARTLVSLGHDVRVIGVYGNLESSGRELDEGVRVWRLREPKKWFGWVAGRRELYRRIAEWARRGALDVVEVPDWQGWAAHWPSLPVPVITKLHGSATYFAAEMGGRTGRLTRRLEGSSLHRSDFWCSVSRYTANKTQTLFQLPNGPDAILPNPVVLQEPSPWQERRPGRIVFSGTLTEKKGVVPLVDAWPGVARQFSDATLHFVGKDGIGPDHRSMTAFLKKRLSGRPGADRVHFHGHLPRGQVLGELAAAHIAVFPSFAEALALAPLEAMSVGCPTIVSSLGSGPELVEHGQDGLTVDPRDPSQIERALLRLLGDEGFARHLAENGRRKIASHFSAAARTTANLEFYAECIARHRKESGHWSMAR